MADLELQDIPAKCPVTGGPLYVSELTSEDGSVTIRGKFRLPGASRLERDQQDFLDLFLRARGVISTVEKEMGLSYPTVRARLDALIDALGLTPIKEGKRSEKAAAVKRKILEQLEAGEITPEQAKAKLKVGGRK